MTFTLSLALTTTSPQRKELFPSTGICFTHTCISMQKEMLKVSGLDAAPLAKHPSPKRECSTNSDSAGPKWKTSSLDIGSATKASESFWIQRYNARIANAGHFPK